ncbi:MAG: hypothetical protein M0Q02_11780 [Candidatus Muirbacterium halophilum]|nr:hypothetical protein [Candidatus Muirbacterium halophilum]
MSLSYIKKLNSFNPWLTIELTNLCNYNCIMCYREEVDIKQKGFININLFNKIIKDIKESGLQFYGLKLAWLGEAFMHPEIYNILDILNTNKEFFNCIAFDTNISFIEKQHIDKLNKLSKPVFLFLSIDAECSKTYTNIRKNGNFNKIIENINIIEKNRNSNIYLRYQFIPMKENIHELKDFIEKFQKKDKYLKILKSEKTDLEEDYIFIRKLVYPGKENESTEMFIKALEISGLNISENNLNSSQQKSNICHKLYTMPIIRWNGIVGFCNNDPEMSLSPGTITENLKFSEIWINLMKKIRIDQENCHYQGKCKDCFIKN